MDTKTKIKKEARGLFNKKGVNETTLRDVAYKLEKSYGNITYHYKNKELLLKEICLDFSKSVHNITNNKKSSNSLINYFSYSSSLIKYMNSFAFLHSDYLNISRKYPAIKVMLDALITEIYEKKIRLLERCKQEGLFSKNLNANSFKSIIELEFGLFLQLLIANNLRLSSAEINRKLRKIIFPYLTDKGKLVYIKF